MAVWRLRCYEVCSFRCERHLRKWILQYESLRVSLAVKDVAWRGDADFQTSSSGEESEAKKIVESIKQQGSLKAGRSEKGIKDELKIINHNTNSEDARASREDGYESETTQYSSESSDSTQGMGGKTAKFVEPENPGRRSTRSKRSSKAS